MHSTDNILIWDSEAPPPENKFTKLIWRGFVQSGSEGCISIPELIDKNAETLRSKYLALIYELGELKVVGGKLIDHLEIRPGFSYWWMTLIAEKCNCSKSPLITDVIKLLAFDEWAKNNPNIKSINLASDNDELIKCLEDWCDVKNIHFECQCLPANSEPQRWIEIFFYRLPYVIQATIWLLKHLINCWPLCGVGVENWQKHKPQLTLVSYFFNLRPEAARKGRFDSYYWTKLPYVLGQKKIRTSWLHIYVKNSVSTTASSAAKLLTEFNANHKEEQAHVFLESFLSIRTVAGAIRDYIKIRRTSRVITKTVSKCLANNRDFSGLSLWPLFRKDWERSFFGKDALQNLLSLNLFEKAFSQSPKQNAGIYLQENQGWEFGMIYAWKASRHGPLTGFPHSTVRFWDLRYFFDPRSYSKDQLSLPMPTSLAVSGNAVRKSYRDGGYPREDLVEVEGLRYLFIHAKYNNKGCIEPTLIKQKKLLVLGDYLSLHTAAQMRLLQEIADHLPNIELTVKPHPACPIEENDYPEFKFMLTNKPLSELVGMFNVVYTSNMTSAAVDAYSAGLKVISAVNSETLNLSPLIGVSGVRFVRSAAELRQALVELPSDSDEDVKRFDYFNVDPALPRWRKLISANLKTVGT